MKETDEKVIQEIEKIMATMDCPKSFKCYKCGLKKLCKSKDFGMESFLECLEKNPHKCPFAVPFGNSFMCQCPLRIYIAKKLNK